jgi:hypothetical protein
MLERELAREIHGYSTNVRKDTKYKCHTTCDLPLKGWLKDPQTVVLEKATDAGPTYLTRDSLNHSVNLTCTTSLIEDILKLHKYTGVLLLCSETHASCASNSGDCVLVDVDGTNRILTFLPEQVLQKLFPSTYDKSEGHMVFAKAS